MAYEGGCDCGAIRYQCEEKSEFQFHCQCRNCQRMTGTGHSSLLLVKAASVNLSGDIKTYKMPADGGATTEHGFCANCGNPIYNKASSNPELMFLHAASLDDPSQFKPTAIAWHGSAPHWDHMDGTLKILN